MRQGKATVQDAQYLAITEHCAHYCAFVNPPDPHHHPGYRGYTHFIDEETEAPRNGVNCHKSETINGRAMSV